MSLLPKRAALLAVLALALSAAAGSGPPAQADGTAAKQSPVRTDRYSDPLPNGAIARLGSMRLRHDFVYRKAAFSADGRILATLGWRVRLWDAATGRLLREFDAREMFDLGFALSPDGKTLVTLHPGQVHLWDVASGKGRRLWTDGKYRGTPTDAAFSPDGKLLALGGQAREEGRDRAQVRLYDSRSLREIALLEPRGASQADYLAFAPDGKRLAFRAHRELRVWDVSGKKELLNVPVRGGVAQLAFAPNGKTIAVQPHQQPVALIDAHSGKATPLHVKATAVTSSTYGALRFTPDGKTLLFRPYGGPVLALDPGGRQPPRELLAKGEDRGRATFSPDGKRVAFLGAEIRVWNLDTGKPLTTFDDHRERGGIEAVPSPDGRRVATRGQTELRVWGLRTGKLLRSIRGTAPFLPGLRWSPDGRALVVAEEGAVGWWDSDTGKRLRRVPLPPRKWERVHLLAGGTRLAGSTRDASGAGYYFLDARTGKEQRRFAPPADGGRVTLAPDGRYYLVWDLPDREKYELHEAATGRLLWKSEGPYSHSRAAFAGDGRLVAAATWNGLRLWETATGREVGARPQKKVWRTGIQSVALSPNGKTAAVVLQYEDKHGGWPASSILLVEAASGRVRREFPRVDGLVRCTFTADGNYLVSGSTDGTALVWEVSSAPAKPRAH